MKRGQKNNSSNFVTKKDIKVLENSLRAEIKLNTNDILTKVDENARKYKDEILAKMDEVMGELGVMRDENTIGSGQTSQLRQEVQDHETRIKHLEKAQQTV